LRRLGAEPLPRRDASGQLFETDGGNRILDCRFGPIADPAALEVAISQVIGVVEVGLFIGMAKLALVADDDGVRRLAAA
jgi:ribose 5-phosphate isomerase A